MDISKMSLFLSNAELLEQYATEDEKMCLEDNSELVRQCFIRMSNEVGDQNDRNVLNNRTNLIECHARHIAMRKQYDKEILEEHQQELDDQLRAENERLELKRCERVYQQSITDERKIQTYYETNAEQISHLLTLKAAALAAQYGQGGPLAP